MSPSCRVMTVAASASMSRRSCSIFVSGAREEPQPNGAAQTQAADVTAASHDRPACTGSKGCDPECSAHGIDDEQQEDDAEASERGPCKVGRVEPSSAIGQTRQQQRYADAAFGEGADE